MKNTSHVSLVMVVPLIFGMTLGTLGAFSLNTTHSLGQKSIFPLRLKSLRLYITIGGTYPLVGDGTTRLLNSTMLATLTPNYTPISWSKIVWSRSLLPRHAIILWFACWKRLPTLHKLASCGIAVSDQCKLCERFQETQEHLFFNCPISKQIWTAVIGKLGCTTFALNLDSTLEWLLNNHWTSKLQKNLVSLCLSVAVYCIWKERNQRLYNGLSRDPQTITGDILQTVRNAASTWRKFRKTQHN